MAKRQKSFLIVIIIFKYVVFMHACDNNDVIVYEGVRGAKTERPRVINEADADNVHLYLPLGVYYRFKDGRFHLNQLCSRMCSYCPRRKSVADMMFGRAIGFYECFAFPFDYHCYPHLKKQIFHIAMIMYTQHLERSRRRKQSNRSKMSIQQQLNSPDMIHWRRPRIHSTTAKTEIHFSRSCKYIKLMDWFIEGTSLRCSVLLRHCKCRHGNDRSILEDKDKLKSSEFGDGVEIHFYTEENEQNCTYDIVKYYESGENIYELSKTCFCPRVVS